MRRYCISPIIGSGSFPDAFRASVSDVPNVNAASIIPTGQNGHPLYNFALCCVAAANMTQVQQVSNLYLLPDHALDSRMDAMESEARTGFEQSIEAFNLDGNGLHFDAGHEGDESYRTVLNRIGQQLDAAFNVDRFGVTEPLS